MKKYILILLVATALFGSSCTDFLSVNEVNPNSASKVTPKLVLPTTLTGIVSTMNNPRRFDFVYLWHGLWSISAGYSQPAALSSYKLINSDYQNAFNELYLVGNNLDAIEKSSTDAKDVYYLAMAKIMKAYIFQTLVDCWGNVPYSEAFKTGQDILKPKYDDQKVIYEDLVVKIDEAIALIQNAPSDVNAVPGSSDIMYAGNMTKWLKFANTLKLRILVQQSGMTGRTTYIKEKIATTASVGYMGEGDGALVNPGYLVSASKMNPFYNYFYSEIGSSKPDGVTYYTAGKDVVDFYNANSDLRRNKFFKLGEKNTTHAGNIFGSPAADLTPFASTSQLGYVKDDATTMIGTATKASPLFTDFEALFLQAEAVNKGLITSGSAQALYESGVKQSFAYMGLTDVAAAAYVAQANIKVNFGLATTEAERTQVIITQKWASLNGIAPLTIWSDYRRTGYPAGLNFTPDVNKLSATPPVRLLYPQTELSVNNDNVLAVGTIDAFTSKIFWQNR
ncbi:MAG: SusD/RagB family nutrient-binding outer membrane lipoprotein [Paludibacter sp.]